MKIYVDVDGTICNDTNGDYENAKPNHEAIAKINKLHNEGNIIIYWTARGRNSGIDWSDLTLRQLKDWKCEYHAIDFNPKPAYDQFIDDKTKRIEEI